MVSASCWKQPLRRFAERYLSNVKPRVDRLAATCEEMGGDLKATIADHQKADAEGGTAFN